MQKTKFFAVAIVLALTSAVYAAGNLQQTTHAQGPAKSEKADCCAAHKDGDKQAAMSCDKNDKGCCAARNHGDAHKAHDTHETAGKQTASTEAVRNCCGESCCATGASCCAGDSCDAHQKKDGATIVKTSATADAESCCSGGGCCSGNGCCAAHKETGR
jgi:hypothetical protein